MALVVKDRVKETTTTTGTGTITLAGAVTGFQAFTVVGDGNQTYYTIAGSGSAEFEVGIGTYTSSGTTLSRDVILESSNAGSAVNFSAGIKDVFVTYPASRAAFGGASAGIITNSNTLSEDFTFLANYNGFSVGPITIESGIDVTLSGSNSWFILSTTPPGTGNVATVGKAIAMSIVFG
jgi:hypothetical protein